MYILTMRLLDLFCELYQFFYDVTLERDSDGRCEIRHSSGEVALVRVFQNLDDIPLLKTALMGHLGPEMPFNKKYGYSHTYVINEDRIVEHYEHLFSNDCSAQIPLTRKQEAGLLPTVIHEIRHGVQSDSPNLSLRTIEMLRRYFPDQKFGLWHKQQAKAWQDFKSRLWYKYGMANEFLSNKDIERIIANEEDAYATQFLSEYFWAVSRKLDRATRLAMQKSIILN